MRSIRRLCPLRNITSCPPPPREYVVRLSSGSLAVFSPVALTDATRAKVEEMGGQVGYIVALDIEHHIFISQWAKAFPNAKIIGPEGLPEKRAKQTGSDPNIGDDKFAVVFTKDEKHLAKISDEFDADFAYEYIDGHANRELVFLYRPERTLIEADLLFNLPATEQYSKLPESERQEKGVMAKLFAGMQSTDGDAKWMKRFNWYLAGKDRQSYNESLGKVEQWDFVNIIPCHGDVIEGNGKEIFHKVFEWHLHGKK